MILESSCYDYYSTGATPEKALNAINFSDWEAYSLTKKIGLLGDICKMAEDEALKVMRE